MQTKPIDIISNDTTFVVKIMQKILFLYCFLSYHQWNLKMQKLLDLILFQNLKIISEDSHSLMLFINLSMNTGQKEHRC